MHERQDGWLHVFCQVGCNEHAIMASLGLRDEDRRIIPYAPATELSSIGRPHPVYTYEGLKPFTAHDGYIAEKHRFPPKEPDGRKSFVWKVRFRDGQPIPKVQKVAQKTKREYEDYPTVSDLGMEVETEVIYRLPQVRRAIDAGKPIVLVESEKATDLSWEKGMPCTNQGYGAGPGKWRQPHTDQLRGAREIIIVADRDKPGEAYASEVFVLLRAARYKARVFRPKTTGDGDGWEDHLEAGYGIADLVAAPDLMPPRGLQLTQFGDDFEPVEARHLVHPYLQRGKCILLDADGGCVAGDTLLDTSNGPVAISELAKGAAFFLVKSLDECRKEGFALATRPFLKGADHLFEIESETGKKIRCTADHRFLTDLGWDYCANLAIGSKIAVASEPCHLQSSSGACLSAFAPNARHSCQTTPNCQCDCWLDCRLYGEPPLSAEGTCLNDFPSLVDARGHSRDDLGEDGRAISPARSHRCQLSDHHSKTRSCEDVLFEAIGQFHDASSLSKWRHIRSQEPQPFLAGMTLPQPFLESARPGETSRCTSSPYDTVTAIRYVGVEDYYDLHVPGYENYIAHGMVHHNTGKTCMAAAWAASITNGLHPTTHEPLSEGPQKVLYLHHGEDTSAEIHTVFLANGGDRRMISYTGAGTIFDARGLALLEESIEDFEPQLVIVDALFYFLAGVVKDTAVAMDALPVMERLNAVASRTDVCFLNIRHTVKGIVNKRASDLGMGAPAFRNSHRGQLVARFHPKKPGVVVVEDLKGSLLNERGETFYYRRVGNEIQYLSDCDNPFETKPEADDSVTKLDAAQNLLRTMLTGHWVKHSEVYKLAKIKGISVKTLERARGILNVESKRLFADGGYMLYIRSDENDQSEFDEFD